MRRWRVTGDRGGQIRPFILHALRAAVRGPLGRVTQSTDGRSGSGEATEHDMGRW